MTDTLAKVTVTPSVGKRVLKKFARSEYMTTDLPAEALGELVARSLNLAWRAGFDPADKQFPMVLKITFESETIPSRPEDLEPDAPR